MTDESNAPVPAPHESSWERIKAKIQRVEEDFSQNIAHIEAYFAAKKKEEAAVSNQLVKPEQEAIDEAATEVGATEAGSAS